MFLHSFFVTFVRTSPFFASHPPHFSINLVRCSHEIRRGSLMSTETPINFRRSPRNSRPHLIFQYGHQVFLTIRPTKPPVLFDPFTKLAPGRPSLRPFPPHPCSSCIVFDMVRRVRYPHYARFSGKTRTGQPTINGLLVVSEHFTHTAGISLSRKSKACHMLELKGRCGPACRVKYFR